MKNKKIVALTLIAVLCMTLFAVMLVGCAKKEVPLTGINLIVDKTSAGIGEKVKISFEPVPKDANVCIDKDGTKKDYDAGCIEFYLRNGDKNIALGNRETSVEYTVKASTDMVFWAKYCHHSECGDKTELDVVSEDVTVTLIKNEIKTVEDLQNMKNDKVYFLANDIDMTNAAWTPYEFAGVLDGAGHKITNLKLENNDANNYGLFSFMKGTIRNLTIENALVNTNGEKESIGILAGVNKGTIDNVIVSGEVNAAYAKYVGGIVGQNAEAVLLNSTNNAVVTGNLYVGGVAGHSRINRDNGFAGNVNNAAITGTQYVGGVAGEISLDACDKTRSTGNNKNTGDVEGVNCVGGVFGNSWGYDRYMVVGTRYKTTYNYLAYSNLSNTGNITATGDKVGGLIGNGNYTTKIMSSENKGDITGKNWVGGFVGYSPNTRIVANNFKNENVITGTSRVGGFAGEAGVIEDAVNSGEIVSKMPHVAEDEQLAYVGGIAGYAKGLKNCSNTIDIVVSHQGKYVGGLAGYVYIDADNNLNDNTNLASVTGYNHVGGIAGYVTPHTGDRTYKIANDSNSGIVNGNSNVGGVFGTVWGYNKYMVVGTAYRTVYNYLELNNMQNVGNVVAEEDKVGGIVGNSNYLKKMIACDNKADIVGKNYVGGWIGYGPDTLIVGHNKENNNKITGNAFVGGFAGLAGIVENAINNGMIESKMPRVDGETLVAYTGGIAGYAKGLKKCTNTAEMLVTHQGQYVGGLAGYVYVEHDDDISGNTNNGRVSANDYVGGIAGYITPHTGDRTYKLKNNTNTADISGKNNVAGIFGTAWGYNKYMVVGTAYRTVYNYFELSDMHNQGAVVATGDNVGGIVGKSHYLVKVIASENTGNVTGKNYVGGWLGNSPDTKVMALGLTNEATITGNAYVGGIAGMAGLIEGATNNGQIISNAGIIDGDINMAYVGGIAGECYGIRGCTNNHDIAINYAANNVGGLAGRVFVHNNDYINDNKNYGIINAPQCKNVGGIAGYIIGKNSNYYYKFADNENYANITGAEAVGGIIGYVYGESGGVFEVTNSSNAGTIAGSISGGIVGNYQNLKTDAVFMDTNTTTSGNKLGK